MHAKRVCRDFEIKDLGEYHNSYLKTDTLLVSNVFKNFRKICLKLYHIDPTKILLANGWTWKTDWSKIRIINWYWDVLIV